MADVPAWRSLAASGDLLGALQTLRSSSEVAQLGGPTSLEWTWAVAEIEERCGDSLWFHGRPGGGVHYRAAMAALMPPGASFTDEHEAERRQTAWTRISEKALYGSHGDGTRRNGAEGRPHPSGNPPVAPPPLASPPARSPVAPTPLTAPSASVELRPDPIHVGAAVPSDGAEAPFAKAEPPTAPNSGIRRAQEDSQSYGHLRPGRRYRIETTFTDFDGTVWPERTIVRFEGYSYFPYDEGLTLRTDRGSIRLCGLMSDQSRIMDDLESIFRELTVA